MSGQIACFTSFLSFAGRDGGRRSGRGGSPRSCRSTRRAARARAGGSPARPSRSASSRPASNAESVQCPAALSHDLLADHVCGAWCPSLPAQFPEIYYMKYRIGILTCMPIRYKMKKKEERRHDQGGAHFLYETEGGM